MLVVIEPVARSMLAERPFRIIDDMFVFVILGVLAMVLLVAGAVAGAAADAEAIR